MTPAFNENVERAANGWGSAAESPSVGHAIISRRLQPDLYECMTCGAGPQPFQSFPSFMGIRVCAGCYLNGFIDTIRRV